MKFPYVNIHDHFKPVIPVVLRLGDEHAKTEALVDSGADASLFHAEYAELLGIKKVTDGEHIEFFGISGAPARAYRHVVSLEVGGNQFYGLNIAFSPDLSPDTFNILGQEDFFALFPIKFNYAKQEIHLMTSSRDVA